MSVLVYKDRDKDEKNANSSVCSTSPAERCLSVVMPPASSQPSLRSNSNGLDAVYAGSLESRTAKLEQAMDTIAVWMHGEKMKGESSWWKDRVLEEKMLQLEARVSRLEGTNRPLEVASTPPVMPAEMQEHTSAMSTDLVKWQENMEAKVDEMIYRADQAVINLGHGVDDKVEKPNFSGSSWKSVDQLLRHHMNYEWECSVYDGLLIAFLPSLRISILQSFLVVSGFIVNSVMLMVIISIIADNQFHSDKFSKTALQEWRISDGHSHVWAHPTTSVTLVNRVCNLDKTLSIATDQKYLVDEIRFYKSHDRGWLLCNVAIILWSFCCCDEVRASLRFGAAVWNLPRGQRTSVSQTPGGDEIKFSSISSFRSVGALAVATARAAFAFALMYFGGIYLANITSIEDLLLNASAFGFVLDIDNIAFSVLAPLRAIGCIKYLRPEPVPKSRLMKFLPLSLSFCIVAFCVYVNVSAINPMGVDMEDAVNILCEPAGSLQYSIAEDTLGRIVYTQDTPDWRNEAFGRTMLSTRQQIVQDLIQNTDEGKRFAIEMDTLSIFNRMSDMNVEDLVNSYRCRDNNTVDNVTTVGDRLFAVLGTPALRDLKSCADASSLCHEMGAGWLIGSNVRLMCPVTCGCESPYAGLWDLARATNGCPHEQCSRNFLDGKLRRDESFPCRDQNLTFLRQNGWKLLVDRMLATGTIRRDVHTNLTSLGCEALEFVPIQYRNGKVRDICSMNSEVQDHGAAPFCPISCRCATAKTALDALENCPGLCPSTCCAS